MLFLISDFLNIYWWLVTLDLHLSSCSTLYTISLDSLLVSFIWEFMNGFESTFRSMERNRRATFQDHLCSVQEEKN